MLKPLLVQPLSESEAEVAMSGDLVWAAQWQLLDLKGVWYRREIENNPSVRGLAN